MKSPPRGSRTRLIDGLHGHRDNGPTRRPRTHSQPGTRAPPGAQRLIDPYAKAIHGDLDWDESLYDYRFSDQAAYNDLDSLGHTMLSVVINPFFDWGGDRPPRHSFADTVIYEAHVKGMTMLHPDVLKAVRGTYAGLAHPAVIDHLKTLGVTAVELMPVHQFVHNPVLLDRGGRQYWGYDTIGFFAPHQEYSSTGTLGQQVGEFKAMVRAFHEADIEVILDVVYNHTAEGNHLGPTLSFKGIDNAAYYRLVDDDSQYYMDYTGSGNAPRMQHPHMLQLLMDSLRYWVTEMHVDGFRFDLASALARELYDVDRLSTFFELVQQDPIVGQVKLIAEPWDLGPGGYQVGNFPAQWSEWNGKYRDTVRDFWRGEPTLGEFASRLVGSSDLYEHSGRRPFASINFVTAHDGFTLRDLVSYDEKHNEANGEDNRDGESFNRSWNHGMEGPTEDIEVLAMRARAQRNFLTTLLLSQGVPMLLHGDELGRTQNGNNNTYAQDNELSWVDWRLAEENRDLLAFMRRLSALRRDRRALRRRFTTPPQPVGDPFLVPDVAVLHPEVAGASGALGLYLNGHPTDGGVWSGGDIGEEDLLLLLNDDPTPSALRLPPATYSPRWTPILNTDAPDGEAFPGEYAGDELITVPGRTTLVLTGRRSSGG